MKKLVILLVVLCVASTAFAQGTKGNGAPKGKFEKFLLVAPGDPKDTQTALTNWLKSDDSNGRAIFIPLRTTNGPEEEHCSAAGELGYTFVPDVQNNNLGEVEPMNGVKLWFTKDETGTLSNIDIVDRDATDGDAEIMVPASWATATTIDLYIRVLGKPGGCIGMDAYVIDGATYYFAGSVVFKRKAGQSLFIDASDLTDVWYCPSGSTVTPTTGNGYTCTTATGTTPAIEYNVFSDIFDAYFWDINNDGIRVVQVLMRAR